MNLELIFFFIRDLKFRNEYSAENSSDVPSNVKYSSKANFGPILFDKSIFSMWFLCF